MKTYVASIKGITAILQHRFSEASELPGTSRRVHIKDEDPRDAAERAAHRDPEGRLYIPGAAVSRMLREGGSSHKQKGSRKSLKFVIPAAILIPEDIIHLLDVDGEPLTEFEVDSRPVVIPATKGRIMRHRPRLNIWGAEFHVEVDDDMIDPNIIHQILVEGGTKIGLGDFRPEKGGPFGRFHVVRWAEMGSTLRVAAE